MWRKRIVGGSQSDWSRNIPPGIPFPDAAYVLASSRLVGAYLMSLSLCCTSYAADMPCGRRPIIRGISKYDCHRKFLTVVQVDATLWDIERYLLLRRSVVAAR